MSGGGVGGTGGRCIREDDVLKTVPDLFQLGEDSPA